MIVAVSHDDHVRRIQRAYPRIWHHCHVRHPARGDALSDRESTVLSHLSWDASSTPAELARHLGIGASTLSEAVDKLVQRGLVERHTEPHDRRCVRWTVTRAGQQALDDSSVLSRARLGQALSTLSPDDRQRAVVGLELLAQACRASIDADAAPSEDAS